MTQIHSLTLPGKCPICGASPIIPLLPEHKLVLQKPDQNEAIEEMLAYRCFDRGHMFFVRRADVEHAIEEMDIDSSMVRVGDRRTVR